MLQLLSLFAFSASLLSLVRGKVLRLIVASCLSLFCLLQLSAYFLTGEAAGYRFYFQLLRPQDVVDVMGSFVSEALLIALSLLLLPCLLWFSARLLSKRRAALRGALLALGLCGLFLPRGVVRGLITTTEVFLAEHASFDLALQRLGIDPQDYVRKESLEAKPGRNLIILGLESYERGFLKPPFDSLTPTLGRLSREEQYIEWPQCPGGDFTLASLYLSCTGVPGVFGSMFGDNDLGGVEECKLTAYTDVLKKAGYGLSYLLADKNFAGTGPMLAALGYEVKSREEFKASYPVTSWGLHDLDLFTELKKEVLLKKAEGRPFCIGASTISTHFPDGVYDPRMKGQVPEQRNHLEFMVAAVDHYIADLIDFLQKEGLYESTTIVVFPDHLFMGKKSATVKRMPGERGLYFLAIHAVKSSMPGNGLAMTQLDIPSRILASAGVKHNAKFLVDYIDRNTAIEFVRSHQAALATLNVAALDRWTCQDGFLLRKRKDGRISMVNAKNVEILDFPSPNPNRYRYIEFDARFRPSVQREEQDIRAFAEGRGHPSPAAAMALIPALMISEQDGLLYACLRIGPYFRIAKRGSEVRFTRDEIRLLEEWKVPSMTASVPSTASYPCGEGKPRPCPIRWKEIGEAKIGSPAFELRLENGPSPPGFQRLALFFLSAGDPYSGGLKIPSVCGEVLALYPRLDRPSLITMAAVQAKGSEPCGLTAALRFPIPRDPKLAGAKFSAQWLVLNWKVDEKIRWQLTLSQLHDFTLKK